MLTAAVSGQVFASPSVKAVLAGIRAVARPSAPAGASPGALLIVKNYTGDRLSFGLAMSKAVLEGIPVEMVIVADDVTLPRSKGVTGRRGIAGTVLVHKIAGAAAAQGKTLAEVARLAEAAASSIVSIGIATTHCNVPGNVSDPSRLPAGMMELGVSCSEQCAVLAMRRVFPSPPRIGLLLIRCRRYLVDTPLLVCCFSSAFTTRPACRLCHWSPRDPLWVGWLRSS